MDVYYENGGLVWYQFHDEKRRYRNVEVVVVVKDEEVQKKLKKRFWIGKAVVASIIGLSLLGDILSAGAGAADDIATLIFGAKTFKAIMACAF